MRPFSSCFLCHVPLVLSLTANVIIGALFCTMLQSPLRVKRIQAFAALPSVVQNVVRQESVEGKGLCTTLSSSIPTLIVSGASLECPLAKIQEGSTTLRATVSLSEQKERKYYTPPPVGGRMRKSSEKM